MVKSKFINNNNKKLKIELKIKIRVMFTWITEDNRIIASKWCVIGSYNLNSPPSPSSRDDKTTILDTSVFKKFGGEFTTGVGVSNGE